jgi:phospholipid/cholesterol/gamma-HCH transport system ATP-binding protein
MYELPPDERNQLLRRTGTAFQQDALFGSMTLEDNISRAARADQAPAAVICDGRMRLALVGLPGMAPRTAMSGGQRKRAALARASILDPELVPCDEPSAGLDPVVAAGMDETRAVPLRARRHAGRRDPRAESTARSPIAPCCSPRRIRAAGTIDELASDDPEVFGFFHRVADKPAQGAIAIQGPMAARHKRYESDCSR